MTSVLVIGEKTSQVKRFVETICGSYQSHKQTKYIYTYTGTGHINTDTFDFTFLPLAGHISTIDTTDQYGWGKCAPIRIVHDQRALVIRNQKKYVSILRKQIKNKQQLWLATDPDSEGDNIAWEALQIMATQIKKQGILVRRIWNSSLTSKEIWRAFVSSRPWTNHLALAVLGRRFVDAWMGFAGTREITRAARQVASVKVLSIGRVQLPTLYLIVQADLAHETFVPVNQWIVIARLLDQGIEFDARHEGGYQTEKKVADELLERVKNAQYAVVINRHTTTDSQIPPQPLNTTSAVSLLSKTLKITASKALELMVELYNKGLLSYPRTENKKFKTGFPHKDILSSLIQISKYLPYITTGLNSTQVRNNGPKKGEEEDHDPIHPTGEVKGIDSLPPLQAKTFDILTRYYISLFMDDLQVEKTSIDFLIRDERFLSQGRRVTDLGWRKAQWWVTTKQNEIPSLNQGDQVPIQKIILKSDKTKPPKRYSDAELLLTMERSRIGTKSSRPDILKKLQKRNYIQRRSQRLISTSWGRSLIASLAPIWPELVTPKFTAHVEELMDNVAKGKSSFADMFIQLRQEYLVLHQKLIEQIPTYQDLLKQLNLSDQNKAGQADLDEINKILTTIQI